MRTDPEPDAPEDKEDLSDTEGELQDFLGSDETGDGDQLPLSDESQGDDA